MDTASDTLEPSDPITLKQEMERIENAESLPPPLVLEVKDTSYDSETETASVKLTGAFQKVSQVRDYDGDNIVITYNGIDVDPAACPKIIVSLDQIERDISIFTNSVRLNVSGISAQTAETINDKQCFTLDTQLVKDVINPPSQMNSGPGM